MVNTDILIAGNKAVLLNWIPVLVEGYGYGWLTYACEDGMLGVLLSGEDKASEWRPEQVSRYEA